MDIQEKIIWQQAAGDGNRNYVGLCLEWNVILNGPGEYGSWPDCADRLRKDEWTERKITDLWRFCEEMKDSNIVVLRLGTSLVYGVGRVVGEYEYCEEFNDVDGWTIAHVRRINWLWKNSEKPKEFNTYTLKWGDTTQLLDAPEVKVWLESLEISDTKCEQELGGLPNLVDDANVSIDDISEYLFDKGVASDSISSLLDQIGEFVRIAKWYRGLAKWPSEHETVTYLVVPLLRALGWTPQRMAIEWNKIDVALFSSLPREDKSLSIVVEAKKMESTILSAREQAEGYANEKGRSNCRRVIVTDGLRYGVYTRGDKNSGQIDKFSLYAYLNLTRLRNHYPIYQCEGAKHALLAMAPEWQF